MEPIRCFTVFQTSEGWFWNWPHLKRPVGPFPTLPSVLVDMQNVMGVTEETEHDKQTSVWRERALRAEKELAEVNERLREQLMQSLADQAQELDMGY